MAQKTRETANAIYYDSGAGTQHILSAIMGATQDISKAFLQTQAKKDVVKEAWAKMGFEERKRYWESLSERERKLYNLPEAPTETPREKLDTAQATAELERTTEAVKGLKTSNKIADLQLTAEQAREAAKQSTDPFIKWHVGHGLSGEEADRMIMLDMGESKESVANIIRYKYRTGPKYEAERTAAHFSQLHQLTGEITPQHFPLAAAMAKAEATGDRTELEKLLKDPKLPPAMRTLAQKNYLQEEKRITLAYAQMSRAQEQAIGSAAVQILTQFGELGIGPKVAEATARAYMTGKPLPDWTVPYHKQVQDLLAASRKAATEKAAAELAMRDINGLRESINTLSTVANRGGDAADSAEEASKKLVPELEKKIREFYRIPEESDADDAGWGAWGREVTATVGKYVVGAATVANEGAEFLQRKLRSDVIQTFNAAGEAITQSQQPKYLDDYSPEQIQHWEARATGLADKLSTPGLTPQERDSLLAEAKEVTRVLSLPTKPKKGKKQKKPAAPRPGINPAMQLNNPYPGLQQ
jgi:hypothetical protein